MIITYDFGDRTETLDISKIQDFIVDNELNREKVSEYVEQLAAKYDTKGIERDFTTYDDRKISVSGGDYGWKIDQEKETEGLMKAILSGQTDVRTPVYEQEARERDANDIGYTYIEIDKQNKQFILYVDGDPAIQITGELKSLENGVYSLKTPSGETDGKSWYLPFGSGQCIYGADLNTEETAESLQTDDLLDDLDELTGISSNESLEIEDGSFAIQSETAEMAFSSCTEGMPVIVY